MYDESFQAKVFPTLRDAFDVFKSVWNGRFYYLVPPTGAIYPCGVYQSQDNGGNSDDRINLNRWEGIITFRSIARSLSEAEQNMVTLSGLFHTVTNGDYSISIRTKNAIPLPIEEDSLGKIYTVGLRTRVGVYPK